MADGWGNILAAGVNGYLRGQGIVRDRKEAEEDQAYKTEIRAAQRTKLADEKALRQDLRTAAQPVAVVEGANGAVLPPNMDNRDVGQPGEAPLAATGAYRVGAQQFADPVAAAGAAQQQNAPAAIAGRQAQVYAARGMPSEAATLENRQAQLLKTAMELKEKGVFEGARALRQGNKDAAVKALKGSGYFNIDGDVTMEPEDMDLPGIGKIKAYNLKFNAKNPDGTTEPVVLNSHQLSIGTMTYEKQLELQRKGMKDETTADLQTQKLGLAQQRLEMQGALNEARIARMQAGGGKGGGGGKEDREYRLQLQNMTSQLNREIREADVAIKTLKDDVTVKSGDPRLVELASQRSQLAQRRSALNDEFVSLAETKRPGNENLAQQRKTKPSASGGTSKPPEIKSKAEYDQLPSGAVYVAPNGETMRKK
jgi:hypothetical protein